MITPELKDKILSTLCSWEELYPGELTPINTAEFLRKVEVDSRTALSILDYFQHIGLIGELNYRHSSPTFYVIVYTNAFDICNRGGFVVQEQLFQKEVEKLLLEIKRLKPALGDKAEQITTIANNLAGIAGAFFGAGWSVISGKS